jgi:hypothetical protein
LPHCLHHQVAGLPRPLDHEVFFKKQVALLNHPDNKHWRSFLYKELVAWYDEFKPTKKRKGRSLGRTNMAVNVDADKIFIGSNLDGFDDPWNEDGLPQPPGRLAAPWPQQRPVPRQPREAAVEN